MKGKVNFVVNEAQRQPKALNFAENDLVNQALKRPQLHTKAESETDPKSDFNNFKLFIKRLLALRGRSEGVAQIQNDIKALFPVTRHRKTVFFEISFYLNDSDVERAFIDHKNPETVQIRPQEQLGMMPEPTSRIPEAIVQANLKPRTLNIPKKIMKKKNKINPKSFGYHRFFTKRSFNSKPVSLNPETFLGRVRIVSGPRVTENVNVNKNELVKSTISCYLERLKCYWNRLNPSCPHIFAGQGLTKNSDRYERLDYCLKMIPTMNENEE